MQADGRRESVKGVREPLIKLVRGGGDRGRRDAEVSDRTLQTILVGFVPHGSGGGGFVSRRRKVDEDGDVI